MYEFMENVQIARLLNRCIVLPDILFSSQGVFLDLGELSNVVTTLALEKFHELATKSPPVLFYNQYQNNISDYVCDSELNTLCGKLKVGSIVGIDAYGLFVANALTTSRMRNFSENENWIVVNNEKLQHSNWHRESNFEYSKIRVACVHAERLRLRADAYSETHHILERATLLVHWDHDETDNGAIPCTPTKIFGNVMRMSRGDNDAGMSLFTHVFLVCKNVAIDDQKTLRVLLKEHGMVALQYERNDEELYCNQSEVMVQQLIGSRCFFQFHNFVSFDIISSFGRWIIEERRRYHPHGNEKQHVRFVV